MNKNAFLGYALILIGMLVSLPIFPDLYAQTKPRSRDIGVPFDGTPGRFNASTDVAGVEVGHTTLIAGTGPVVPPVRTGVTAMLPRGKTAKQPVFAGWFS